MSRLSEGRISYLAHLILSGLWKDGLVDVPNEPRALKETKEVLVEIFNLEERLDELVRRKIQSLSRPVPLGSREWEVLYRKYMDDEKKKQRL